MSNSSLLNNRISSATLFSLQDQIGHTGILIKADVRPSPSRPAPLNVVYNDVFEDLGGVCVVVDNTDFQKSVAQIDHRMMCDILEHIIRKGYKKHLGERIRDAKIGDLKVQWSGNMAPPSTCVTETNWAFVMRTINQRQNVEVMTIVVEI